MAAESENEPVRGRAPDLAEKVSFLSVGRHYPKQPDRVEVVQTHMSYVFLTPTAVYKLKKPVHNVYFDFRTLESRRHNCEQEVRLNRRLAPTTYLGVIALKQDSSGGLQLGGSGRTVDCLVHMRRLPSDRMLDQLIQTGQLTRGHIDQLGRLLVEFYRRADGVDLSPDAYVERYRGYVEERMSNLRDPFYQLDPRPLDRLEQALHGFIERAGGQGLADRAGRLVEAHGDLKPEHVCFTHPPEIIDCLEFSRELRSLDPVEELSYLAIECERLDAAWVGERLLENYIGRTGDQVNQRQIGFYKAYRGVLRAHLSVRHLLDEDVSDPDHWLRRTRRYLELALRHAGVED